MRIKIILFSVMLLSVPLTGESQDTDFGLWYGLELDYPVIKKLDIGLSSMIRTFKDASKIEKGYLQLKIDYDINSFLSVAGSYRLTENLESDSHFHIYHRWMTDLKINRDFGDIDVSGRFRFQRRDKTYFEDADDEIPDYYGRFRLKTEYKTPSFPLNPYLSTEIFCRLLEESEKTIDKYRLTAGLEYKITKRQSVEAEYLFQRDYLPKLTDINIIAIVYCFSFG